MFDKKTRRPRIFFGWWTVLATGIISGLGHGYYQYGISVFFKSLAAELDLSRATTSLATGVGRLEGGLESFLTGWLVDKFGPKWVIFTGVCIASAGLVLMYFINSTWAYILVWGVTIGTGINLGLTVAVDKVITDWFVSKRGLAQGIKFALLGAGGVLVLPLVTWLVLACGWRLTCLIWAIVMLACAPFTLLLVKQKRPEFYGLLPDGVKPASGSKTSTTSVVDEGIEYASGLQETEFTLRQVMKTPVYWQLNIAAAAYAMISGAIQTHSIPILTDMGIDPTTAGAMVGLMVFFTIPSRFLTGLLADRVRKVHLKFLLAVSFLTQAIGLGALLLSRNLTAVYIFLIFFGFGNGACTPAILLIMGRYYGRKAFGSILGSTFLLRAPAALLSPIYAGWVYDTTGNYMAAFTVFAIIATFSVILACSMRIPKPPSTTNADVRKFM